MDVCVPEHRSSSSNGDAVAKMSMFIFVSRLKTVVSRGLVFFRMLNIRGYMLPPMRKEIVNMRRTRDPSVAVAL